MEYRKTKSAAKVVLEKGSHLSSVVLKTMKTVSNVVGSTLGPGGHVVLIERQEQGLPPFLTKDGVTVFRALGFKDPAAHCIMEVARDSATKTASDAGDGTTTATILSESIVRYLDKYLKANPKNAPQKIVRQLEKLFQKEIEPLLIKNSIRVPDEPEKSRPFLHAVARVSANGDSDLADAVMSCFDICGDSGNVTIMDSTGPSHYEVEHVEGFPIPIGYEESCAKFFPVFINDVAHQRCVMQNCVFVLYHGKITETQTIVRLMMMVSDAWQNKDYPNNVVLVSCGFSENVLGDLAGNFPLPNTINVLPLVAPMNAMMNSQQHFLQDLSAFTGSTIFDPLTKLISKAELTDLGRSMTSFEATRFRSTLVGEPDELLIFDRINVLKEQLKMAESKYEVSILNERIAKLTGGIAKLKVVGSSGGELREKRDRAEDAVCAVRGAIKNGFLPGGGWGLLKVCDYLANKYKGDKVINEVLIPALQEPIKVLLLNVGISNAPGTTQFSNDYVSSLLPPAKTELETVMDTIVRSVAKSETMIYDAQESEMVDALNPENMILDSLPAVLEAIRNAISIATQLGTTGGVVVFDRDNELERSESQDTSRFLRDASSPEDVVNERI